MSGPLTEAARSRLRWIRKRPELPSWWTLLQVALGIAFFCYVAYSMMTSGQHKATTVDAQRRDLGHGIVVTAPTTGAGSSAPDEAPTAGSPSAAPSAADTPPVSAATVTLMDQSGAPVPVPSAAADLATRAMRAAYDPSLFSGLPVAAGESLTVSGQRHPNASVGPLQVVTSTDTSFTFSATGDPDGTGRTLQALRATVIWQAGRWVYTTKS